MMKLKKSANNYRHLRVASLIKVALEEIFVLGKNLDVRLLRDKCNFTNLMVSPDLKLVTCYFIPCVSSNLSSADTLDALNSSKFAIRKMITAKVFLKFSPEFRFIYDDNFDKSLKVSRDLAKTKTSVV
jgi:ribosome-binding factor A